MSAAKHVCHAKCCNVECIPTMLMCIKHWRMVPIAVRRRVWAYFRPEQVFDKKPSSKWLLAANEAVAFVAMKEGVSL